MRLALTASAAAAALLFAAPALAQDMSPAPDDAYADQGYPGDDGQYDPNDPSSYGGLPPPDDYGDAGDYGDQPGPYPDEGMDPNEYDPGDFGPGGPDAMPPPDDAYFDPPPPGYEGEPYDPVPGDPYIPADPGTGDPSMGDPGSYDSGMGDPGDDGQVYGDGQDADQSGSLESRLGAVEARIRAAADQGRISPHDANNALIELNSIRTQQDELLARDGRLTGTSQTFLEDRLDLLEGRLETMGGA